MLYPFFLLGSFHFLCLSHIPLNIGSGQRPPPFPFSYKASASKLWSKTLQTLPPLPLPLPTLLARSPILDPQVVSLGRDPSTLPPTPQVYTTHRPFRAPLLPPHTVPPSSCPNPPPPRASRFAVPADPHHVPPFLPHGIPTPHTSLSDLPGCSHPYLFLCAIPYTVS